MSWRWRETEERGIGKALALRPDLILLDVIMPNINGFETLRELDAQTSTLLLIDGIGSERRVVKVY
jgi:DNA-binding response OmpR family regulator